MRSVAAVTRFAAIRLEARPVSTDDKTQLDPLARPRIIRMVRRFEAPPSRLYRCWTDPEEIVRWFPEQIEGSIAL